MKSVAVKEVTKQRSLGLIKGFSGQIKQNSNTLSISDETAKGAQDLMKGAACDCASLTVH